MFSRHHYPLLGGMNTSTLLNCVWVTDRVVDCVVDRVFCTTWFQTIVGGVSSVCRSPNSRSDGWDQQNKTSISKT